MTTSRTALAAVAVALLVGLAGCAAEDDSGSQAEGGGNGTTQPTGTPPSTEPTTSPVSPSAMRVEYSRSGGIAGGEQATYTFVRGQQPPPGFTAAEQREVLQAAAAPALRQLPPNKMPKDSCCDLFVYQVTVSWADGETRTFTTVDGMDVAPALDTLLQAAAG
jgi:hypothetical protein